MSSPHCPHCGAELPDEAPQPAASHPEGGVHFCPACGRRVEGWRTGYRASVGGAAVGGELPSGEDLTKAIKPSPSLLRAAAASAEPEPEPAAPTEVGPSDSMMLHGLKRRRMPLLVGGVVAAAVVAGVVFFRSRPTGSPRVDAPPVVAPPAAVVAPVPAADGKKHGRAHRIAAPTIAPPSATERKQAALPHQDGGADRTDTSKSPQRVKLSAPPSPTAAATAPPQAAQPSEAARALVQDSAGESTPMTPEERGAEDATRADADNVRFVVKAHLAQVHACYSRAFKDTSPGGRVEIGFSIGESGKASKVHTESNSTASASLAKCLEQRVADWDFPRPASGELELIYPFVFSPGS